MNSEKKTYQAAFKLNILSIHAILFHIYQPEQHRSRKMPNKPAM